MKPSDWLKWTRAFSIQCLRLPMPHVQASLFWTIDRACGNLCLPVHTILYKIIVRCTVCLSLSISFMFLLFVRSVQDFCTTCAALQVYLIVIALLNIGHWWFNAVSTNRLKWIARGIALGCNFNWICNATESTAKIHWVSERIFWFNLFTPLISMCKSCMRAHSVYFIV